VARGASPGPFGLIGFTREVAPGPRVRLGLSQRLGRQPDAVLSWHG
jgi:hypothetical protein